MKKKLLRATFVLLIGIIMLSSCQSTDSFQNTDNDYTLGILEDVQEEIEENNYVGSINSDKYHYPQCRWAKKIKEENEIWFYSTDDAMDEGYVFCGTCNP